MLSHLARCAILVLLLAPATDACMRVTPSEPGIPATPCKTCAANLIAVTTAGAGAKPMDSDTTVTTGACAMRTFVCTGLMSSIELFTAEGTQGAIDDGGTGTATVTVTCNAAGTAWEAMGLQITAVECSAVPACSNCDPALITKTRVAANSKDFDNDQTTYPNTCAVRTFTCTGTMANIAVTSGAGMTNVPDGGAGTSTLMVTCNADGTGWTNAAGETVTAVECQTTVAMPCTMCAANLITVDPADPANPGSKAMDGDVAGMANGCSTRTFTCNSPVNPVISVNGGASMVADAADGATDGSAMLVATCNAAGTGWVDAMGNAVTQVGCTVPCKTCGAAAVALTTSFEGMYTSNEATIDRTGSCAAWNIQCTGPATPSLEPNMAGGSLDDASDGATDGTVNFPLVCKPDGTLWFSNAFNVDITSLDCAAAPAG